MAIGLLLGVLTMGGFAYVVSQLIQPLSIFVAILATVSAWWWLNQRDAVDLVDDPLVNWLLEGGLAGAFGFFVYRLLGWAFAALGFGLAFLVIAVFLAGGPVVFVYGYQLVMAWVMQQ